MCVSRALGTCWAPGKMKHDLVLFATAVPTLILLKNSGGGVEKLLVSTSTGWLVCFGSQSFLKI